MKYLFSVFILNVLINNNDYMFDILSKISLPKHAFFKVLKAYLLINSH